MIHLTTSEPSSVSVASVRHFYSNSFPLRAIRSWRDAPSEVTSTKIKVNNMASWHRGCQEVQTNDDKEKGKTVRQEKKKKNNHRPGWKIRAIIWISPPQNVLPDDWHKCVFFSGLHFHNRWNSGTAIIAFYLSLKGMCLLCSCFTLYICCEGMLYKYNAN